MDKGIPQQQSNEHKRPPNQQCRLLSNDENNRLFRLIGDKCVTMVSGIVQLFLAVEPDRMKWIKKHCGVVCLIKDYDNKSYFIRIYNILNNTMLWEQEVYNQFKYLTPRPKFHTFTAHNCQAALNFSNVGEADTFRSAIHEKLRQKENRRRARGHTVKDQVNSGSISTPTTPSMSLPPNPNNSGGNLKPNKEKKDKKKKKSKLTTADIGTPSNFKHVGHVGWDPDRGFNTDNLDPALKQLFQSIGLSDSDLNDKLTTQTIFNVIEKFGGVEAVRKENEMRRKAPMPPVVAPPRSRGPAPAPPSGSCSAVPTNRSGNTAPPLPSRPIRAMPIPAAPITAAPHPPFQPRRNNTAPPPPAAPGTGVISPPAPPSPPPPGNLPPPPPPFQPTPVPTSDPGSSPDPPMGALLQEIRQGRPLSAPNERPLSAPNERPLSQPALSDRDVLLDGIRHRPKLRPVSQHDMVKPDNTPPVDGIAGALIRALQDRYKDIQDGDQSSGDEDYEEDDEEWDDD